MNAFEHAAKETLHRGSLMPDNMSNLILLAIVPVTSLAGLANLLRTNQPLTKIAVASVMLNSGLFGIVVASYMIHQLGSESLLLTLAVSTLSGLGGNAVIDFAFEIFKSAIKSKFDMGTKDGKK